MSDAKPCICCCVPDAPVRWLSPMGSPLCDHHKEVMDAAYGDEAKCRPMETEKEKPE
jgi:hypothetical protein